MALPVIFGDLVVAGLGQLDENFAALGNLTPIPCAVVGTNVLAMTPIADTPTLSLYVDGMQFTGIATATNTASTSAAIGALPALVVYKDTAAGPQALTGGEIAEDCAFTLRYDPALGGGGGGFHLLTGGAMLTDTSISVRAITINSGAPVLRLTSGLYTVTFSVIAVNWAQDQLVTISGVKPNDNIFVGAPSLVLAGITYQGYVSASGTVALRAVNGSTATVTPPSGPYRLTVMGFT